MVALVIVLVLLLSAGAAVGLLWWRGEASLDRLSVEGLTDRVTGRDSVDRGDGPIQSPDPGASEAPSGEPPVPELSEPFTVLVTGVDGDVSNLTPEERRRVALGGEREGDRPDTIILLRVDPAADQVAMLSLPRDLLVRRCDGSLGKINGSYFIGEQTGGAGPSCLVQTITRHTGIAIQHYVEVSFAGFIDVVDAIGGVRMYIPDRLVAEKAKLDLQPGCQVLDGPDALAYVRGREPIGNDFARMARQQAFAEELVDEVTSAGTLANPLRLYRLVDAAASAVDVDDTLGIGEMRRMAASLRNLDRDRLATASITGAITTRDDLGGASVVVEDRSVTEPIYRAFRQGRLTQGLPSSEPAETEPAPSATPTTPIVAAEEVPPLRVLNAVGTPELAADGATLLRERGFTVDEIGDSPIRHSKTVVQYGPGLESEAETVAQALGGVGTRQRIDLQGATSTDGGEIIVMLGKDLQSLNVPDVRGSVAPPDGPTGAAGETPGAPPTIPEPDYMGIPAEDEVC